MSTFGEMTHDSRRSMVRNHSVAIVPVAVVLPMCFSFENEIEDRPGKFAADSRLASLRRLGGTGKILSDILNFQLSPCILGRALKGHDRFRECLHSLSKLRVRICGRLAHHKDETRLYLIAGLNSLELVECTLPTSFGNPASALATV